MDIKNHQRKQLSELKTRDKNSVLLKTICAAVEDNISGLFMFIENKRNII